MKRVPLRMTIRTVLALTAVVGVMFAMEVRKWRVRKAIAQAIRQNDGFAKTELVGPSWLRQLVGDHDAFSVVTHVDFGPGFAGSGVYQGDPIGDTRLQQAIAPVPSGTNLELLCLDRTAITDQSLPLLGELRISRLKLEHTGVTDAGIRHVSRISGLTDLDLGHTEITDQGVVHLKTLTKLQELSLASTAITDVGLSSIANLPSLRVLNLDGTSITDAGLHAIYRLESLRTLVLRRTNVTASGVKQLRVSLPKCRVGADY